MFEYVADDDICRDENEGSIIASLISQLRFVRAPSSGDPLSLMLLAEWGWTYPE